MNELINGRTPEKIRFNISECSRSNCLSECPYDHQPIETCAEGLLSDALALIKHLESERDAALAKVPKWISVKDKLPEKECKVLVYIGACNITQGWYLGDGVFEVGIGAKFNTKSAFDRIVLPCWMPLPEPPKEEE